MYKCYQYFYLYKVLPYIIPVLCHVLQNFLSHFTIVVALFFSAIILTFCEESLQFFFFSSLFYRINRNLTVVKQLAIRKILLIWVLLLSLIFFFFFFYTVFFHVFFVWISFSEQKSSLNFFFSLSLSFINYCCNLTIMLMIMNIFYWVMKKKKFLVFMV